jgi:multiple antibiotic resistance protein
VNVSILIKTFVAVFVLADALGNAPIFLILTKGMEPEQRNSVVDRASLVATAVLLSFAFGGQWILKYLEISIGSLRVAGGLLLLLIALQMLQGELDTPIVEQQRDVAITPLALPLLAGPGTLTTVMLLMSESPDAHLSVWLDRLLPRSSDLVYSRRHSIVSARLTSCSGAEGPVIDYFNFWVSCLAAPGGKIGKYGNRELFS